MKKYEVTFKCKPWYTGYAAAPGPNVAINLVSRQARREGLQVTRSTPHEVKEIK